MRFTSLAVTLSSVSAASALIALLICLPQMYYEMHELQHQIVETVQSFKVDTDSLWADLMDIQVTHAPPTRARENPLLRREKRFAPLPDWCQCDSAPQCPPGPPGPPGTAGTRGTDGDPGPRGMDNPNQHVPETACEQYTGGCIKCPRGLVGPPGPAGPEGPAGPDGLHGTPGTPGRGVGVPGPVGPPGDAGLDGQPGLPGEDGTPGAHAEVARPVPGPPGKPGNAGPPGVPGAQGANGSDGAPGHEGPAGHPGDAGPSGHPGVDGVAGGIGIPGRDAEYCPCPPRSFVFVRRMYHHI